CGRAGVAASLAHGATCPGRGGWPSSAGEAWASGAVVDGLLPSDRRRGLGAAACLGVVGDGDLPVPRADSSLEGCARRAEPRPASASGRVGLAEAAATATAAVVAATAASASVRVLDAVGPAEPTLTQAPCGRIGQAGLGQARGAT